MIRQPVASSNIKSVGYDPASLVLEVEFGDGSVYQYNDVSHDIQTALMTASSPGSFLHRRVKAKYTCRKVS